MSRKLLLSLLVAASAAIPASLVPAAPAMAQNVTRPASVIVLSIGKGELVNVNGRMADIFVANEAIADVQVKSDRQVYVFGKAGGETTVYASNAAGDVVWSATVRVGSNIDSVDQMLRLAMPESNIQINTMSGTVLLTGTVASPEDAAEAERLVQAFTGEATNVISRLRMATPLQVNLQVRFAEVSRSLVREIGANLQTRDGSGGFLFGVTQGRADAAPIIGAGSANLPVLDASASLNLPAGSLFLPYDPNTGKFVAQGTQFQRLGVDGKTVMSLAGRLFGLDINSAFDLSERLGLVTTLSQPNLTALSGETAEFLAGGEFPIPVGGGNEAITIDYKKYGVSLAYTPTVLSNGRISLRVRPEVSELSSQGSVTLNGFQVPALTVRRAETTVELGSGQSFMIAGLMSNNAQSTLDKAPGAGDLPILGNLFRSRNFRRGETELVIIVTPYLVNPVNANDIVLPTDAFQTTTEASQLLLYRNAAGVTGGDRAKPTAVDGGTPGATIGNMQIVPVPEPGQPPISIPTEHGEVMLPSQPQQLAGRERRGQANAAATAASTTPGFSLD